MKYQVIRAQDQNINRDQNNHKKDLETGQIQKRYLSDIILIVKEMLVKPD